jgi:serine protease
VAPITKVSSKTYLGFYSVATVTPTTAPRSLNVLQVANIQGQLQVAWTPYSLAIDRGGLPVTYSLALVKASDDSPVACAVVSAYACNTTGPLAGTTYTARLIVANSRGSVSIAKSIAYTVATSVTTNDEKYSLQWYLKSTETYSAKVSYAWSVESGLDSVTVAILDTGYTDHPDLPASKILPGYDMISSSASSNDGDGRDADAHDVGDYVLNTNLSVRESSSWHGTHVAGIVAAADNDQGVLGIAPNVKLLPVRVLGADGGTTADIISGIYWAAGIHRAGVPDNPNKANVINLSIGGYSDGCDNGTEAALAAAKAAGITVVTAAGNDNPAVGHPAYASLSYPGNCYPTINVGSSGKLGKPAFYSNFSNAPDIYNSHAYGVDISAPGGDYCQGGTTAQIYSTLNSGSKEPLAATYAYEIGTSMAAPMVSGTVALMYSAKLRQNSNLVLNGALVDSIWNALSSTSTPFASNSPINCPSTNKVSIQDGGAYGGYGVGILNAKAALDALLQ